MSSIKPTGKTAAMTTRNHQKREPLNAERIVNEALALVDRDGLEKFSFRVLARHLGCEAMSIYHYFPSKTHLFDAMLDHCLAEIQFSDAASHWIERIRLVAYEWRDMALRHPGFFPFVAVHRLNTRFALGVLNNVIALFAESGREPEWQAKRFRALGYYLMGALLDETSGYAHGPTTATPVSDEVVAKDFPAVSAAGPYFAASHHLDTFRQGLELHLSQLAKEALR